MVIYLFSDGNSETTLELDAACASSDVCADDLASCQNGLCTCSVGHVSIGQVCGTYTFHLLFKKTILFII